MYNKAHVDLLVLKNEGIFTTRFPLIKTITAQGVSLELTPHLIADVTLVYNKADKATTYLKTEVDTKIDVVNN